jgi:hypothetical protein
MKNEFQKLINQLMTQRKLEDRRQSDTVAGKYDR